MARREDDAALLDMTDTRGGATEGAIGAFSHLDENQRAAAVAHHQVDLAAAAPGRPIIAGDQLEAGGRQVRQRALLGGVAGLLGAGGRFFLARDFH